MLDAGTSKNLKYRNNEPHVIVLSVAQSEYGMCVLQKHRSHYEMVWAKIDC